jgi:hypothetical protein
MTLEEALENGLTGVRDKKAIHFFNTYNYHKNFINLLF